MRQFIPDDYLQYFDYLPDLQRCANIFMTFTPLFSYGSTCYSIYSKQTSMGFSLDICATMFMASILRIFYYFITPYEVTLLRQSIIMIFIQSVLLKTSLHFRPPSYNPDYLQPFPTFKNEFNSALPRRLSASTNPTEHESYCEESSVEVTKRMGTDILSFARSYILVTFHQFLRLFDVYYKRPASFWQWLDEYKYWSFLLKFAGLFGFLTIVFRNNESYGSVIGFMGLFIESLLPLPQILLLHRLKSIKNFKVVLLLSWLGGDLTKISYLVYGARNVSKIFISAGLFQMSLDIIIAFQYFHFGKNDKLPDLPTSQDIELREIA